MSYKQLCKKRIGLWPIFFALFLISGCATVNVPNVGEKGYILENDERRLSNRAQEVCDLVDVTDEVYPNNELEQYLKGLAVSLLPDTVPPDKKNISIKVLNDPVFNAFALPNGRIFINIGALSAADNEAQLATLLGHELTHILNRHALKQFRSLQNKSAFMSVFDLPLGMVGGSAGIILGRLGMLSSIYGYSQEHEFEADVNGFETVLRLGYDVRQCPKLFENLLSFIETEEVSQPFFFSTHPHVKERVKKFNDLLVQKHFEPNGRLIVDTKDFQKFAYEIYTSQIQLCLSRGMFKTAQKNFENLKSRYANRPETFFWGGEIYRLRQDPQNKEKKRNKGSDYLKAREFYDMALALDANFSSAIVGKARILEKLGQKEKAKGLFRKYLDLNPQAADREYIENFIKG